MSTEDASEGGGHGPVSLDFPRGRGESTWWPLVAAIGAIGLYFGAGVFFVSRGENPILPPILSVILVVLGLGGLFTGAFGWLYHGFVAEYWSKTVGEGDSDPLEFGMLLFLISDIATFSAGFVYYASVRSNLWPPVGLEIPEVLSTELPIMTVALGLSSVTLHLSHRALGEGNRRRFFAWLGGTIALGLVFVLGQVYEYYDLLIVEDFSFGNVFGSAFFGLTTLHGLHVAFGVFLLGLVFLRGRRGQYSPERDTSVVTVSMYWHLVDAFWFVIIIAVYLSASIY